MIGVLYHEEERHTVEEFFELFKTPWEPFSEGRSYSVIITSSNDVPETTARLILIFGSGESTYDCSHHFKGAISQRGELFYEGTASVPLYGEVRTFEETVSAFPCLRSNGSIVGLKWETSDRTFMRLGYDLFDEVAHLLSAGQPVENAHIPTLDLHIQMLRDWIISAGVTLVEVPPTPAGYDFSACLSHDIDFVGIRRHKWDHTVAGFLYRATAGSLVEAARGRQSLRHLFQNWKAAASLPFVYLGWANDFWLQFDRYLEIEKGLPATYYFIPFKHRPGEKMETPNAQRRATAYDITDIPELIQTLLAEGCEVGVHGIDAWHDVEKGKAELERVKSVSGQHDAGIRMHWLARDAGTMEVLEQAGYSYDSTVGYNETVGYRAGTSQVFRPPGVSRLLELPMHIQDGALFYRQRLSLSKEAAWLRCERLIENSQRLGGVLTILWHDRSLGPERFWDEFYIELVKHLRSLEVWFATGSQIVQWFRQRRKIQFERTASGVGVRIRHCGEKTNPSFKVNVQSPQAATYHILAGGTTLELETLDIRLRADSLVTDPV